MRQKICTTCSNFTQLSFKDRKYLDFNDDFVCSPDCMLRWIRKYTNRNSLQNTVGVQKLSGQVFSPRSNYEKSISVFLDENNIKWDYERYGFIIKDGSKKYTYTPDFYLPENNCFLEVKGCWGVGQKNKMKLFKKQYSNIKLLVVSWILHSKFEKYINDFGIIR